MRGCAYTLDGRGSWVSQDAQVRVEPHLGTEAEETVAIERDPSIPAKVEG